MAGLTSHSHVARLYIPKAYTMSSACTHLMVSTAFIPHKNTGIRSQGDKQKTCQHFDYGYRRKGPQRTQNIGLAKLMGLEQLLARFETRSSRMALYMNNEWIDSLGEMIGEMFRCSNSDAFRHSDSQDQSKIFFMKASSLTEIVFMTP